MGILSENCERSFEADVQINRFRLEICCEEQPSIYLYWAELRAEARSTMEALMEEVKILEEDLTAIRAKEELGIRTSKPEKFGLDKFTESSIAALLESSEAIEKHRWKIKEARQRLIEAKTRFNELDAAVEALEHRRDSLKVLKDLYLGGYYANPEGTDGGDSIRSAIREKLNKK